MFENLTERLQRTFKNLRGQGKLSEEHLDAALVEIREALLEGDVNVGVADELLSNIRKRALGSEVMLQLSPDQQVVKIVRDELLNLLGKHAKPLFASRPPSVWMIVGLQGSGKTTTTGKLAKWLSQHGHRPIVVSTDVYRPAAREQLSQVAKAIGISVWQATGTDKPLEIVRGAIKEAKLSASDVVLVDTAGRLHIDDELMNELSTLKKELQPTEMLFIADAMIGQDAVRSAGEFHKRLGLTGVILTKLDGDARGGAALSISKVSGAPVKFVGLGEKYDALEALYPAFSAWEIFSRLSSAPNPRSIKRQRWNSSASCARKSSRWKISATSCARFGRWVRWNNSWVCSQKLVRYRIFPKTRAWMKAN